MALDESCGYCGFSYVITISRNKRFSGAIRPEKHMLARV
jgi:hypothetical protein